MPKEAKEPKKPAARKTAARKVSAAVRKPRAKKTAAAAAVTPQDVEVRAYFLHLEQPWADPAENWLRAERELAPA